MSDWPTNIQSVGTRAQGCHATYNAVLSSNKDESASVVIAMAVHLLVQCMTETKNYYVNDYS